MENVGASMLIEAIGHDRLLLVFVYQLIHLILTQYLFLKACLTLLSQHFQSLQLAACLLQLQAELTELLF